MFTHGFFFFFQEFDAPSALLQNSEGYLSKLVDQTGPNLRKNLMQMATKWWWWWRLRRSKAFLNLCISKKYIANKDKEYV